MKKNPKRQPMQPLVITASGVLRFKMNPIVDFMLKELRKRGFDLNDLHLAEIETNKHDWDQFNQLIGYSVSGCPILDELTRYRADDRAQQYSEAFEEIPSKEEYDNES